jgi:preprotein translocase subunit SecG
MDIVLWVVHILAALALIGLVMIQHGKGADIGAAFGSGASTTVFGARGSANFLSRGTAILAVVFFVTSLSLAYFVTGAPKQQSVVERAAAPAADAEQKANAATEQELLDQLSQQLQKKPDAPADATPASPTQEPPKP